MAGAGPTPPWLNPFDRTAQSTGCNHYCNAASCAACRAPEAGRCPALPGERPSVPVALLIARFGPAAMSLRFWAPPGELVASAARGFWESGVRMICVFVCVSVSARVLEPAPLDSMCILQPDGDLIALAGAS